LITTLATLAARPVTRESRLFHFLLLAMYSGKIGLFSSLSYLALRTLPLSVDHSTVALVKIQFVHFLSLSIE
ncbi:hypothetical protein, partial [Candidatus Burkholderia verschuerenii]|uniref:hypothetical protein n=1 Tax=Candidatus Burkholderia verschuerenii TaxID=242163 RepID=UPI001E463524